MHVLLDKEKSFIKNRCIFGSGQEQQVREQVDAYKTAPTRCSVVYTVYTEQWMIS
jgi:hypothetical protein